MTYTQALISLSVAAPYSKASLDDMSFIRCLSACSDILSYFTQGEVSSTNIIVIYSFHSFDNRVSAVYLESTA